MSAVQAARRAGLTPERATMMFLMLLAAALAVVLLLSAETTGEAGAGDPEGETLVLELANNGRGQGNTGNPPGNSGNAGPPGSTTGPPGPPGHNPPGCNNPVPQQQNPNCVPSPG
jgi:hypothetical protein